MWSFWLLFLKSVFLRHKNLLKSVVFGCKNPLKSVKKYVEPKDNIVYRGLFEV